MDRLRISIVASYYWPESSGTAPYVTEMAEYLSDGGHEVQVATTFPHYPAWELEGHQLLERNHINGVEVRRRWLYVPRRQSAGQRLAYEASMVAAGMTAVPLHKRPDVVVAVMPSLASGVLATIAGLLWRRPVALVIHDLFGKGAQQTGMPGGARVEPLVRAVEMAVATRAARIGIIASGFARYFREGGVPETRLHRLRTWTRGVEPTETRSATRARLGWDAEEFVCVHAGNMGQKQGLDNLVACARLLEGERVRIALVGNGNDRARLEDLAAKSAVRNLSFHDLEPPGLYESVLRAADALLVNQRRAVAEMSLPSKLTTYFRAGKPVIAAVNDESETATEIRASGAGIVVAPDSPSELAAAICDIRDRPERDRPGSLGKAYAREQLDPTRVLQEYERFIAIASAAGPPRLRPRRATRAP